MASNPFFNFQPPLPNCIPSYKYFSKSMLQFSSWDISLTAQIYTLEILGKMSGKILVGINLDLKNSENISKHNFGTEKHRKYQKHQEQQKTLKLNKVLEILGEIGDICNIVLDIDLMHRREIFFIVDLCTFLGVRFNPNNTHSHKLTKTFI